MTRKENCSNCCFGDSEKYKRYVKTIPKTWTQDEEVYEDDIRIRCHRFPIYPTYIALGASSSHPIVDSSDWCGEFKEKTK